MRGGEKKSINWSATVDDAEEVSRSNNLNWLSCRVIRQNEQVLVAGHQEICRAGTCEFQQHIVIGISRPNQRINSRL